MGKQRKSVKICASDSATACLIEISLAKSTMRGYYTRRL